MFGQAFRALFHRGHAALFITDAAQSLLVIDGDAGGISTSIWQLHRPERPYHGERMTVL